MAEQIIALSCIKFAAAGISFKNMSKIRDSKSIMSFCESQGNKLMLGVSGVYVGLSLLLLLPFSEHQLHLANIEHLYMFNYILATLSFGATLLVDKIVGYDYDEQRDSICETVCVPKKSTLMKAKQVQNSQINQVVELQDMLNHKAKEDLEVHLIEAKNKNPRLQQKLENISKQSQISELPSGNYNKKNFILIYFYVVLIGAAIGSANTWLDFIIQLACGVTVVAVLLCRISRQFSDFSTSTSISQLDQLQDPKYFFQILLQLFISGIIIGTILFWFPQHYFISCIAAFNSGTLLYVATIKLLQKYYDDSGDKCHFYLSFFIGFSMIGLAIFCKVLYLYDNSWQSVESSSEQTSN